jgi:hypothetical protein
MRSNMLSRKALTLWVVALAVVLTAGYAVWAEAGSGSCKKECTSSVKSACAASQMGLCTGAKAGMEKKAPVAVKAGPMFPEGSMVTRIEVPDGVDCVFTGSDLSAIEKVLKEHVAKCGGKEAKSGPTCSVVTGPKAVVLSVRGENAASCCMGLASETEMSGPKGAKGCPMQGGMPKGCPMQETPKGEKKK